MRKIILLTLALSMVVLFGCSKEEKEFPPEVETKVQEDEIKQEEPMKEQTKEPGNEELVKVKDYIPDIVVELKYATTDNFTGVVIYEDSTAYLRYGTVKKLAEAQNKLKEKGFFIKLWDGYRPVKAQFKLWEVCPDPTFVANPNTGFSGHSRGNTIDITVVDKNAKEIPMPSAFDEFGAIADREYSDVSAEEGENSLMLETIMAECGFKGYDKEWWHYSDSDEYSVIEE